MAALRVYLPAGVSSCGPCSKDSSSLLDPTTTGRLLHVAQCPGGCGSCRCYSEAYLRQAWEVEKHCVVGACRGEVIVGPYVDDGWLGHVDLQLPVIAAPEVAVQGLCSNIDVSRSRAVIANALCQDLDSDVASAAS